MPATRLLIPPYCAGGGVEDPPPLGTIVVAPADSVGAIAGDLGEILRGAPWCVPCLVATAATADPAILTAIHGLRGQLCFAPGPIPERQLVERVLGAVRGRPVPGGGYLADYVVRRTGCFEIRAELAGLMARPIDVTLDQAIPERTLRDRLRRFAPLTAHCWRAVGTLARVAAALDTAPIDVLAYRTGVGVRTFRAWTRRYLDVSVRQFRDRLGWEWVLEAALRLTGLVPAAAPAELAPPPTPSLPPSLRRPAERFAVRVAASRTPVGTAR